MYGAQKIQRAFQNELSKESYVFNAIVGVGIFISILFVILETVPSLAIHSDIFFFGDMVFTILFLIEYFFRVFYAKNRLVYVKSPLGLIDLLSFLPSLIILIFPPLRALHEFRILRIIRMLRLLRLFRIYKLFNLGFQRKNKFGVLGLIRSVDMEIYFLTFLSVVVTSGTLMYLAESGIPGSGFTSIPQGMWFAVVTISTVGYGDLVPITAFGKIIASITMISGLILLAVLISVVGKSAQTFLFGSPIEDEEKLLS